MITISELSIYPIKGCGGFSLNEVEVVSGGLKGDRRYMLVDSNGQFVTRREEARLAWVSVAPRGGAFFVSAEGTAGFDLPALPAEVELGPSVTATVWRDQVNAREFPRGTAWFRALLGSDLRLLFMPDVALRQVNPERAQPGDVVSFADGYPLLLASEGSLADLNARLETPVPMHRFRPNVVVRGASPFAEDCWETVTLGDTPCRVPKLCDRCVVTTIAEGTAARSKEPLKTLASYRRWDGAVWFAANVIPARSGVLRVGDPVIINSTRRHPRGE